MRRVIPCSENHSLAHEMSDDFPGRHKGHRNVDLIAGRGGGGDRFPFAILSLNYLGDTSLREMKVKEYRLEHPIYWWLSLKLGTD